MVCPHCGTNYEGNYCPKGCNSPYFKKKKPLHKKWWFWAIIAVVLIAAIASSGSDDPTQDSTKPSGGDSSTNTNASSQAESTVPATADNIYNVGDVIDANGLEITYVSAEKYESDNMFLQPDEGYMYIRLKLSAKNTSSSDRYISSFEFECYADGTKMEAMYLTDDGLTGGTISSGRGTEGFIYFTVPVNAGSIEVEYETSFWSDKKAILVVELGK